MERQRPRDWDELEQMTGIKRSVPRAPTRADVDNLTAKRLSKSPLWRKKMRRKK